MKQSRQLRAFAEVAFPDLDRKLVTASVLRVDEIKRVNWSKAPLVAFDVVAESLLVVPYGLGIGRSVAFGFGEVLPPEAYHRMLHKRRSLGGMEEPV